MSDLRALYQEVIIDHGRRPRNFFPLEQATYRKDGHNPLCGDRLTLYLVENNDVIENISFEGTGCAISMASASLMTEALKGKTVEAAKKIFADFHALVTQGKATDDLGKLAVLAGVIEFPARVKCATLAWHTLQACLQQETGLVSTE